MSRIFHGSRRGRGIRALAVVALLPGLAACDSASLPADLPRILQPAADRTTIVERDIEAPEIFDVTEAGVWDGQPSLGGIWVAHPDVGEPGRVIIRNLSNDAFVVGALFRRAGSRAGPRLQVSADAANALGMQAGAPVTLNVTALRRDPREDAENAEETIATPAVDAELEELPSVITPPPVTRLRTADDLSGGMGFSADTAGADDQIDVAGLILAAGTQKMNLKDARVRPAPAVLYRDAIQKHIKEAGPADAHTVAD
tara:strand:- start:2746 stop:3516 length:771 start_codon:yes stop_codon:yes gene_type:complete